MIEGDVQVDERSLRRKLRPVSPTSALEEAAQILEPQLRRDTPQRTGAMARSVRTRINRIRSEVFVGWTDQPFGKLNAVNARGQILDRLVRRNRARLIHVFGSAYREQVRRQARG